tara:strand:+ start:1471 stop:3369 length:1899 start_codon:yes stop_codon:yes gene_type:complete
MKLIYRDLLNLLSEKPTKDHLSEKLFQLGHEHEIVGDIFDIELTPNRGDCNSLLGLARDLNIFFGKGEEVKIYEDSIADLDINFQNLSLEDCPKISFLEIEIDGEVSEYKEYLENYFDTLSLNKTNFFTDISNYISYELGQPTHCFDSLALGKKIIFDNRVCNESFKTLLNIDINLKGKNCIFTDDDKIISLAGVMGGISTACSPETKKVLVECAFFNPEAIVGKSVKYNLVSDAAHKFERGVDIQSQEKVLRRFIEIVSDHATIKSLKICSFGEEQPNQNILPIDVEKINKILGTNLKENEYLMYLRKLNFDITDQIVIPSYRNDISTQNDLSEEIARIIGYNNIHGEPLKIVSHSEKTENDYRKIKNYLINNGFSEVINYPFTSSKEEKSISIDNPLDSNKSYLRLSLKDSLLQNLLYNERRQKDSIKLFEISNIYSKNNHIEQEIKLGIIVSGKKGHNHLDFSKNLDFEYLHETLNNFFNKNIFKIEEIPRESLKTKKNDKIFYAEILINDILEKMLMTPQKSTKKINFVKYEPVSEFPTSTRDFSFSITDFKKYKIVLDHIDRLNDRNLKEVFIFDFYENKKLKEIKVGARFIFQSNSHTLSDQEIQQSIKNLLKPIIDLDGVSVPGL